MKHLANATKAGNKFQDMRDVTATQRAETRSSMDALADTLDHTEVDDETAMALIGETDSLVADDTYIATENNAAMSTATRLLVTRSRSPVAPSSEPTICMFSSPS